ncbi:MAG TPA: TIGR04283 family arsenosugar biosynthesis glycosyltransferase [Candidatus Dorea intestinavium]|nr:TIGR04283 family arsenosugar biosynthesis glycosyltransferase [Candidatus Dorea intestinavium]
MKKAIIIFTRIPAEGKTKTRLMPSFSPKECKDFHIATLRDLYDVCASCKKDIILSYLADGDFASFKALFPANVRFIPQRGTNLGERMYYALLDALQVYDCCLLLGTDVPEVSKKDLKQAFSFLKNKDVVLGPTFDGGYFLVGMKKPIKELFKDKTYSHSEVFKEAYDSVTPNYSVGILTKKHDMDTLADIKSYRKRLQTASSKHYTFTRTQKFLIKKELISIIIPIYNEEKTIKDLQKQLWPLRKECEIIFVDGGSTDLTKELIYPDFTLLFSGKGRANQMNAGAKISHGSILFFLHSDSFLPANFLTEIRKVMIGHSFGGFGISFLSKSPLMRINEHLSNRRMKRGIIFGDQGIFIDRTLFFKIGLYPNIPIMEDYQLSLTLKSLGIRPGFATKTIATSARRYPQGFLKKLLLMAQMARLRSAYRNGVAPDLIAKKYKDIR